MIHNAHPHLFSVQEDQASALHCEADAAYLCLDEQSRVRSDAPLAPALERNRLAPEKRGHSPC